MNTFHGPSPVVPVGTPVNLSRRTDLNYWLDEFMRHLMNESGAPDIMVQHGNFSRDHPSYNKNTYTFMANRFDDMGRPFWKVIYRDRETGMVAGEKEMHSPADVRAELESKIRHPEFQWVTVSPVGRYPNFNIKGNRQYRVEKWQMMI